MNDFNFIAQGWECPKCKRVYSPQTIMCIACPSLTGSTSNNTTTDTNFVSGTPCVFEPGGTIEGYYYPDFCKKCGKQKQYHCYTVYNTGKL
jgi:uncharacterized OB-fold protein